MLERPITINGVGQMDDRDSKSILSEGEQN